MRDQKKKNDITPPYPGDNIPAEGPAPEDPMFPPAGALPIDIEEFFANLPLPPLPPWAQQGDGDATVSLETDEVEVEEEEEVVIDETAGEQAAAAIEEAADILEEMINDDDNNAANQNNPVPQNTEAPETPTGDAAGISTNERTPPNNQPK